MGIIKWWNDVWNKSTETAEDKRKPSEIVKEFLENPIVQEPTVLSDIDRVTNYFAKGGEIVDLSNKPRLPNDGFAEDREFIHSWNEAHVGTKAGLSGMNRRKR